MALHLIKLCVGCDSVKDLEDWIRERLRERRKRGQKREHVHRTRMVPKRADELTDGGSIYWVIRGEVMCRQRLMDVRPFVDKAGVGRCQLVLDPKLVLVEPRPWRAFQGWRYLRGQGRAARSRPCRARRDKPCRRRCAANCANSVCCRASALATATLSISRVRPSLAATSSRSGPASAELAPCPGSRRGALRDNRARSRRARSRGHLRRARARSARRP